MPSRSVLKRVALLGGAAGAVALTALSVTLQGMLPPSLVGFVHLETLLLLSIPSGAALGALTGLALAYSWARKRRAAGAICLFGGLAVLALTTGAAWLIATSSGIGIFKLIASLLIWFTAATLWSLVLVANGLRIALKRR